MRTGATIGGYVLEEEIARGGMGIIYRARDASLERYVAVKVVAPEFSDDPVFRERFRRESRLTAQIEHPNVLPVYRAGQDHGRLFIAMRLIEGADLSAVLAQQGSLTPDAAVDVIEQVARALDAAHAEGLVHRDVKPGNVLLSGPDNRRRAYLTDFGISVQVRAQQGLTRPGLMVGTVAYLAPEQIRGAAVDARTDVYALGGLLHHCLTGQVPFPTTDHVAALSAHLFVPPPRPTSIDPRLPAALDLVVERAMSKDPAARFSSAGELAEAALAAVAGPASTALTAPPSVATLPAALTPLIGREQELAETAARLRDDGVRLLTMTGPGGVGKTRVALELVTVLRDDFPDGACFVDLARVQAADSVEPAIANSLGLQATGHATPIEALAALLGDRRLVLVLDNFEHVIEAAEVIPRLLAAAPGVKVLTTSRMPLRVLAEHEYRLPSLAPDDALGLFVERARAARSDFELTRSNAAAIAEICSRLDGLPLAIELAALHLRYLTPEALLERLRQRLTLLSSGPRDLPARQQTLRATLAWSHDLLSEDEKTAFARLAVFVSGYTVDSASSVCQTDLDTLAALVDASLVTHEAGVGSEPRFRMLETVREYAMEQLERRAETDAIRARLADHLVAVARQAEPALLAGPEQSVWLERLEAEHGNLQTTLDWLERTDRAPVLVRLTAAVARLWLLHGHFVEGARRVDAALARVDDDSADLHRLLLFHAGTLAQRLGNVDRASAYATRLEALARRTGDERAAAYAALASGTAHKVRGELVRARADIERAQRLGSATGEEWLTRIAITNLADLDLTAGAFARAEALAREGAALARASHDDWALVLNTTNLGFSVLMQDRPSDALPVLQEGLLAAERLGSYEMAYVCLEGLASIYAADEHEQSALLLGAADVVLEAFAVDMEPAEQRMRERTLATLGSDWTSGALTASWQRGKEMSLREAIAAGLGAAGDAAASV
jgi:predicted ATPase